MKFVSTAGARARARAGADGPTAMAKGAGARAKVLPSLSSPSFQPHVVTLTAFNPDRTIAQVRRGKGARAAEEKNLLTRTRWTTIWIATGVRRWQKSVEQRIWTTI